MNSKLIEILSSFSKEEWMKFENFVKYSDSESSREYYPLVKQLKSYENNFDLLNKVSPTIIFGNAYGEGKYKPQTVSNRQSELLKLCRSFLTYQAFQEDELLKEVFLMSELTTRRLLKNYDGFRNRRNKILENNLYKEETYKYLREFLLNDAGYFQIKKDESKVDTMYLRYSQYLLADEINNLCKTGIEILTRKTIGERIEQSNVIDFLNSLDSSGFFKRLENSNEKVFIIPLIHFYLFKSVMLPEKVENITIVEKLYFANEDKFSVDFKMYIYRELISYYINKSNRGEKKYCINVFNLINKKLKQNLTSDIQRSVGYNIFREYVIAGVRLKKFKWVEKLIRKYSPLLPDKIRNIECSISWVRLYFNKGEYGDAMNILNKLKSTTFVYYMDISVFKLSIFYEIEKYEEAFKEINKIKRYKTTENEVQYIIKFLKQFLKYYRRLLICKTDPNKNPEDLLFEIEKDPVTYMMKDWIIEKVKIMINERIH